MGRPKVTPGRFLSRTRAEGDCLLWTGPLNHYRGRVGMNKRTYTAPHAAWILFKGPVPSGFEVCHTCDNGACVNIDHLWLGTHAENMADMVRKGRSQHRSGVANPWAKFTDAQVAAIRADHTRGEQIKQIARRHSVDRHTISRIVRRQSYPTSQTLAP